MTPEDTSPVIVNGREFPFWGQFIRRKAEWIGGTLQEQGAPPTELTDIRLEPNGGPVHVAIYFEGRDYTCGCDVQYCGVTANPDNDRALLIAGYDIQWKIWNKKERPFPTDATDQTGQLGLQP